MVRSMQQRGGGRRWWQLRPMVYLYYVFATVLLLHAIITFSRLADITGYYNNDGGEGDDIRAYAIRTHTQNEQQTDSSKVRIRQRVVLLAGPYKSASSSIQNSLMIWLGDHEDGDGGNRRSTDLAKHWTWPSPLRLPIKGCSVHPGKVFHCKGCSVHPSKVFHQWINALKGIKIAERCVASRLGDSSANHTAQIELFRKEYYSSWMEGYSLVIASEAMSSVGAISPSKPPGTILLEKIINQMPWHTNYSVQAQGSDDDITVVIGYRSPRVDHLKSAWLQNTRGKNDTRTFYEYLTNEDENFVQQPHNALSRIDPLFLAKRFLDRGLKVVLVDMAGVSDAGYDISNIIACDILESEECTQEKHFLGVPAVERNVKGTTFQALNNMNITSKQLERINSILENYDCKQIRMIETNPNLTILYSKSLEELVSTKCSGYWKKCHDVPTPIPGECEDYFESGGNGNQLGRSEVAKRITAIAKQLID